MNFEDIFKQQTGVLDCEVITCSINVFINVFRLIKIVKYLRILCSTYTAWLGFIQNLRDTPLDIPAPVRCGLIIFQSRKPHIYSYSILILY